jgi:hypothetical protein
MSYFEETSAETLLVSNHVFHLSFPEVESKRSLRARSDQSAQIQTVRKEPSDFGINAQAETIQ